MNLLKKFKKMSIYIKYPTFGHRWSQDPSCQCGFPFQDGEHLTLSCPLFAKERRNLLGTRATWEELDKPNWRKDEGDDSPWDNIEAWFDFLYQELH